LYIVSLAGWLAGWLAGCVCDMIACRANRISSGSLAIVFRVDDENGGIGIAGHCRRYVIIGIYRTLFLVSTKMAIWGQKAGFRSLIETDANRHCMAYFGLAWFLLASL